MKTRFSFDATRCFSSRAVIATIAVFVVLVNAVYVHAQGVAQYSVVLDGKAAVVRPDLGDGVPAEAATFERDAATGRWTLSGDGGDSSTESNGRFSYAVAVSGDRAVVGAQWQDGFKGAAYVLRNENGTWVVEQRLSPADLGRYDHFGSSAAISGDLIIVGAPWHDLFRGTAYLFQRVNGVWVEQAKLTASDAVPDQQFGKTASIEGGVLTIGDVRAAGGVYQFERADGRWVERNRIEKPAPEQNAAELRALLEEAVITSAVLDGVRLVAGETETPPLRAPMAPVAPDSVKATDGTLEDRVEITWWVSVPQDAIIYKILRDGELVSVVSSDETQYIDVTAEIDSTYEYCVVVKDMADLESTPVCDDGHRVIFAPLDVSASDGEYTDYVEIRWVDISSINTGYSIRRDGLEIGTMTANQTLFHDSTAVTEAVYLYDVVATAGGYASAPGSDSGWRGVILPPKNVSASDGQYLDYVRITWQSQGPDTLGYLIYRDDILIASPDSGVTTYDDSTATFGVTYTYCVATKGGDTVSGIPAAGVQQAGQSTTESIRVCDEGGVGLTAPGEVSASDSTYDDRIRVTWEDLCEFENGYEISRSDTAQQYTVVLDTTRAGVTSYDDFTAEPDSLLVYHVRAISNLGGVSADSSDTGYRSVVLAPVEVKASDGTHEDHVDLTWNSTSTTAVLFKIYRDGTFIKSVGKGDRQYSDYGGTAGVVYSYEVEALNALEVAAMGLADEGSRDLKAASAVSASDETYEDRIVVSWTDNSLIEHGYLVTRQDTASAVVDSFTTNANRTAFTDYTAVPGKTYNYSVRAFDNANGTMGYSVLAGDLGRRVLLAPTDVEADDGEYEDRVEITWVDNCSAEDGYYIYRDTLLVGTTGDNFTTYVDTSPVLGQRTEYSVIAFDGYGESEAASDSGYTTILAPVSFKASDFYEDRIELNWIDRSQIEEGYEVYKDGALIATLIGPDKTSYTELIYSRYDTPGYSYGVAVSGDYAFVADGPSGLQVIDISDPTAPSFAGSYDTPGTAYGVAVWEDYAYVADGDQGLWVIDATDRANPVQVGHWQTQDGGCSYAVSLDGSAPMGGPATAYVADGIFLRGIHYLGPTFPPLSIDTGFTDDARGLAVSGGHVYVGDGAFGLRVFDKYFLSGYGSGWYDTPGLARGVAVSGDYAYVADDWFGLQVIDYSDLVHPSLEGTYETGDTTRCVAISGDYAYLGGGDRVLVIDISNPAAPSYAWGYNTRDDARGVAISGDNLFVANGTSGLRVITLRVVPGVTFDYHVKVYSGTLAGASDHDDGSVYFAEPPAVTLEELDVKLFANDGAQGDLFGWSVAISGDRAIVGVPWDDQVPDDQVGSAYIFECDAAGTWTQKQKFIETGPTTPWDHFGWSVAISGDRAIVGIEADDDKGTDSGSAKIFERGAGGTWAEAQKLLASDGYDGDLFGHSVAISGDRAIVGANQDDAFTGSAYIFERDSLGVWNEKPKILATDGEPDDYFGSSVAISGDRAIVGASQDDAFTGSAYIIERDAGGAWSETQKLLASDRDAGDEFGRSVAISGDRAIVGAHFDDDSATDAGSAYVFERDASGTWSETEKLLASDGDTGDEFGWSVAISGDRAIVGAHFDDDRGNQTGSAYIFERDVFGTWTQTEKLVAPFTGVNVWDQFGCSVAISGDRVIVGRQGDDDRAPDAGSAYVTELPAASAFAVAATDGSLKSRVRVTWDDRATNERGFRIYRDGEAVASVQPNVEVYEDFDAEPGRTYEYAVATMTTDLSEEQKRVSDFGWRPANGNITGRISTRGGAAARGISVAIDPLPTKALLFDGAGGHVIVPDRDGAFGFTRQTSYTIEACVKYAGEGGSGAGDGTIIAKASPGSGVQRYPFSLGILRSTGEAGRIYFKMSDGAVTESVASARTNLNDNVWHHVACVHDAEQDEIRLYIDGALDGDTVYTSSGNIANTEPLTLGAGADNGSWFGGQLDEVRIWNEALSGTQIQTSMDKQLAGDEAGLVAYWPLDEGSLDESGSEGANAAITDLTAGAHYGIFQNGVYWSEISAPLDIYPVTDPEGNYVLRDIRYGTQATFQIRPFEGARQFEPAYRVATLTTEDPVENQVNFTDISAFTVSGVVRYDGTSCPASDIPILVDGEAANATDKNGKFNVSVDLGEHTIEADLEGHTFSPEELSLLVEHDTLLVDSTGVSFTDLTRWTLSGRVGGGCGRSIGDVVITVQSENSCLVWSDTVSAPDSTYSVSLPPQGYLVTAAVVLATIPDGLDAADVIEFFQTLGERRIDLTNADALLDVVYRAPLQVAITGMESYAVCDSLIFDRRVLPGDLPVIPQGTPLELMIAVNEDYGTGGTCPLDSGTVVIYDEIADRGDVAFVLQVRNGVAGLFDEDGEFVAGYRTYARTPSLVIGRTDDQGNDRSFQKYVRVVVDIEGRQPLTAMEWALVTGHVAPEGADFVTFTTEPMPFYILRDPPGDDSYAFLDKGYTVGTTVDFDIGSVSYSTGGTDNYIQDLKLGVDLTFSKGVSAFGVTFTIGSRLAILFDQKSKSTWIESVDSDGNIVVSTTIDERFSTSSDDLFAGETGDVFIGAGLNYIFSEVGVVEVEDCEVIRSKSVGVEPTGFATTFAYSRQYIADKLIPELDSLVAHYEGLAQDDSVAVFQAVAGSWRDMLAVNDTLKWDATLSENRSFSAGADYEYSFTSDTTRTFTKTTTLFKDKETDEGILLNLLGSIQIDYLKVDIDRSHHVLALEDTTVTQSMTVGYALSDNDLGDHFTVDIKSDGRYPSPVFDVRGGVSSCPYEPWPDPSGSARMLARDNPWLDITPYRRDNVQPDEAAVFKLNLSNLSETGESRLYAIRLLTSSNPYGAIVKVAGESILNGQQYYLDPPPAPAQEATLTVQRGPTQYVYEDLAVVLYPPCENALWERGKPLEKADTVYFSVTFEDHGPVVFGTPEPADGELSFGEDISVTFNEPIDCESIRPDSLRLTYLDGPDAGSTVAIETLCNGKTIIFNPLVNPNDLEGRRLEARVAAIQDRAGNTMSSAVTWEFVYRKSRFTWSELHLTREVSYGSPGVLLAELVNGTEEAVDFAIAEIPDTITAEPSAGTILPGGTQVVALFPDVDLEIGDYGFQIEAAAANPSQGVAVLDVHLSVTCNEPTWVVDPSGFEHNMTMVAELDIGDELSADQNDRVAAFVGNQLRGVAAIDSVGGLVQPYVAFLTIYSNRAEGETVRFQVWDDSDCKLYNATEESYPFVANDMIGSPDNPVTLTATETLGDSTLTIAAAEGWTWFSTNVRSVDMSVTGVLSDLTPEPGDLIKSQTAFSQFVDDETGWSGTLLEVDNLSGYMAKLSAPGTIVHTGVPMDTLIPVVRYWNWISYLPQGPFSVTEALADLDGQNLLVDGDVVKTQDAFAEYYDGDWYGNLGVMEPGTGYKLYLQTASTVPGEDSFLYPDFASSPPPPLVAAGDDAGQKSPSESAPSWSVNPHVHQYNMTVTAVLYVGGRESIDENDIIGAFVGDECRGVARPVYVEGIRRYEVFLVVCGDEAAGEKVALRAYDADADLIYNVEETLTFEADKIEGTVRGPVLFTAGSVWDGRDLPLVFALEQNYPNPFNPTTTIGYDVPVGGGHVSLRIYDVAGRLLRTLVDGTETPGRKTVVWDGSNNNGQRVATGVYFYRMTAPGFEMTKKMVLIQ